MIMKRIRKWLYFLLVTVVLSVAGIMIFLTSLKPRYNGNLEFPDLDYRVEVIFDNHGIPHIYAANEVDAYFALGYVHAQDRLFQMELTRRLASGRMSEVFGEELVPVDAFFKTIGLASHARRSCEVFLSGDSLPYQRAALAYLKGLNQFIRNGRAPLEFVMLGIPKQEFTPDDLFLISEYMSFNFSMGFRTEPVLSYIAAKLGPAYLQDINANSLPGETTIAVKDDSGMISKPEALLIPEQKSALHSRPLVFDRIPLPALTGSNSWVLAPNRSSSGKVLFGNDTHIAFGQPAVWYEAHIEYPGFSFYGHYLAGFPFAALGHSRHHAWGLTVLLNDDIDFYKVRINPVDSTQYLTSGVWRKLGFSQEVIRVKGGDDVNLTVREGRYGPLVQDVMPEWKEVTSDAVALSWTHLKYPNNLLEVTYDLARAGDLKAFGNAVGRIISPGLNLIYGDTAGNIAWWAAGRFIKRPANAVPYLLLDGADSLSVPMGLYDFQYNPCNVNPSGGFLYSANNQPDSTAGNGWFPGYYVPEDRAVRINQVFGAKPRFSVFDLQQISLDTKSPITPEVARTIIDGINLKAGKSSALAARAAGILKEWDGSHDLDDLAPTIYYKLLYHILQMSMEDELGKQFFGDLLATHAMKRSFLSLVSNDNAPWWNDINTADVVETRNMIFDRAFARTIDELIVELGKDPATWEWGRVHLVEHNHPIGRKKPYNLFFNAGPFPVPGGPEVINQMGFDLNGDGYYPVKYGPATRIVLDFSDLENGYGILPTGQSGNAMSRNYTDQANLFNSGKFRKQIMNRLELEGSNSGRLVMSPGE